MTTAIALSLLTALVAGFAHALEADHMAAVTAFVSRRPRPAQAFGFGVRWAVGHSLAILLVGGALIALDVRVPEGLERTLEFGVGLMLVGIGVWLAGGLLHRGRYGTAHAAAHTEARPHVHPHGHEHDHGGHATTLVGVAHGLAGSGALVALVPVVLISSPWLAGGYLVLFGVGTVVAMGVYALVAGYLFHRAGGRYPALGGVLRGATAAASIAIGAVWMWTSAVGAA
ncbi:MAG TPA: sulfite exporter TauE/SafE family protein [Longimicrobiaceae bacterium]|jgi:hypothetical protein|nr:sulfite exporter TauE/SafE family protein [Longimicrobiaceae bacterium]